MVVVKEKTLIFKTRFVLIMYIVLNIILFPKLNIARMGLLAGVFIWLFKFIGLQILILFMSPLLEGFYDWGLIKLKEYYEIVVLKKNTLNSETNNFLYNIPFYREIAGSIFMFNIKRLLYSFKNHLLEDKFIYIYLGILSVVITIIVYLAMTLK